MPGEPNSAAIRCVGVPEHFNSLWHYALEHDLFTKAGVSVAFREESLGTGAMCKALAGGDADVAVLLTEGAIADIAKGADHRIFGVFVATPLTWGIHTRADHAAQSTAHLQNAVFGISRLGSGSHLMSCVNALSQGWDPSAVKFEVIGNMTSARDALAAGKAEVFMWEKLTTKWLVESGEWKRVGECVTPWPCFVLTGSNSFLTQNPSAPAKILAVLKQVAMHFKANPEEAIAYISARNSLKPADVSTWLSATEWACEGGIDEAVVTNVVTALKQAAVLTPEQASGVSLASVKVAPQGSDAMPAVMYGWRVKSVYTALQSRGKGHDSELSIEDLTSLGHLDQYHYLGTEACDHVIHTLGLEAGRTVLDVGSGIGGPARYMSAKSGCSVTGIEIQKDLVTAALDLSARCPAIRDTVDFIAGDITDPSAMPKNTSFDHVISLLVLLHVPDSLKALTACHDAAKPGATLLIEDFYQRGTFSDEETRALTETVSAVSVHTLSAYRTLLEAAGFVDVAFEDLTTRWQPWCAARHQAFASTRDTAVQLHGEAVFEDRLRFYKTIDGLFSGGNLGGVRITARRPGILELALRKGRAAPASQPLSQVAVIESGATVSGTVAASSVPTVCLQQPTYPSGSHDMLQYHFFGGPLFVAVRLFRTESITRHTVWVYDQRTRATELVMERTSGVKSVEGAEGGVTVTGEGIVVIEGRGEGTICATRASGETINISFRYEVPDTFSNAVPGQTEIVVYRTHLRGQLTVGNDSFQSDGFSKRYYGDYPTHWGYRWMCAIVAPSPSTPLVPGQECGALWTADACFGTDKYNYMHYLPNDTPRMSAVPCDTYQQQDCAYGVLNGERVVVELATASGSEWVDREIVSPVMNSQMRERVVECEVQIGSRIHKGWCFNEICYGTLA